jgi:RimJ/RimL family protein N-acetyltransferase
MSRTIETARLLLRIPEESDARPLLEIHEHPEVIRFVISGPQRRGITGAWSSVATMIGHWHLRGYGQWTVIEKATGDVIGRVGLWNPEGWPGVELGWIVRYSRWGNGFATESAGAALEWAWAHRATGHIISLIQPDNAASIRVAEKIGERLERRETISGEEMCIYGIRRPQSAV